MSRPQDYLKNANTLTIDEYLKGSPILSTSDYLKYGYEQLVPKLPEVRQDSTIDTALNWLTQGVLGATEMASFGLINPGENLAPEDTGESIARGIGNLAGLAVGPLKVGGALAGRAARIAEPGLAGLMGPKAGKIGANLIRHAGSLGAAEGMVAAGKGEDIGKAATAGALMGATFGVTQLINPANKIVGQLARQFGGRALMAVTGQVEYEKALQQPNIAQTVWHEILNTWFLRNGISLEEVATGKFKDPKKKAMVDAVTDATNHHNAATEERWRAEQYKIADLGKKEVQDIDIKDVYIDEAKLEPKAVSEYEESLSVNPKLNQVEVKWDPTLGKYVSENNNKLAAYINLAFAVKQMDPSDTSPVKLRMTVAIGKSGAPPKLATPAQIALKFLSGAYGDKLTSPLIDEARAKGEDSLRYVIVDAKKLGKEGGHPGGAVRVLPSTGRGEISLGPHQFLVQVDTNGKPKIVAGGSLMSKYLRREMPAEGLPTGQKYRVGQVVEWKQWFTKGADKGAAKLSSRTQKAQILGVSEVNTKDGVKFLYKMSGRGWGREAFEEDIITKPTVETVKERIPTAPERSEDLRLRDEIDSLQAKLESLRPGDVTEADVRKQIELKQSEAKAKGLERIPEQDMLGSLGPKFKTASGMKFDISQVEKQAAKVIGDLRKFPLMDAPAEYVKGVSQELARLDVPMDVKRFLKNIGAVGDDGKLYLYKMREVDQALETLNSLPGGKERLAFMVDIMLKVNNRIVPTSPSSMFLLPDLKKDQAFIEQPLRKKVQAYWELAKKEAAEDPMGGTALQRMLTITKLRGAMDFRYAALEIEEKTGIPLYTIHQHLAQSRAAKDVEQGYYEEKLLPFVRTDPKTQVAIREYYLSRYMETDAWIDVYKNRLDDNGRKLVDTLNEVFKEMEPDIIAYRFKVWYDQNFMPRTMGIYKKGGKVFKNENNPEVQALLNQGVAAFRMNPFDGGAAFKQWIELARSPQYRLGLVESGNYLPLEILGVKPGSLERNNMLWHIDAAGRGRFLSRGDIRGKDQDTAIEQFGHDKNLILSVKNYVSQVLNVKHLDEGLQALNDIVEAFPEMSKARRRGFLRSTPESRAFTTEEYLKLYAMRLKGYPVKLSMFETALKDVQLMFFRSLVVRPILWMRNLAQSITNYPSKKFLDPRFTKFKFEKLPDHVKEWLTTRGVDDSNAFSHAFLELETSLRVQKIPILGKIWDFAGKFGQNYAKTDTWNRKFVYTTTWFRAKYYMDAYREGRIDYEKLRNALDLDKLRPREVLEIKDAITKGNTDEGAFQLAKWMTDNSQWKYSRYERGLDEMTGGGESLSNLFTWSKSMFQHVAVMGNRFMEAAKNYKYAEDPYAKRAYTRQMLHSSADVAGIMIAGAVTNSIYEALTVGHMGKYSPYGADMFTWQFGGVTGSVLTEITQKTSNLVSAFDGTEQERKRAIDDWIKMADKIGVRQMMPFMKQTLAVIESLTSRSFISPLYTLQSKFSSGYWRGLEKVDRTFLEGVTHAIFATDPNKSEDVRRYTYMKLQELKDRSYSSTGVQKEWYDLQVKRYEYLNDLFMRYQPYDVFRQAAETEAKRQTTSSIENYRSGRYSEMKKRYRNGQ